MSYAERSELYAEVERIRRRPLLVYITSNRPGRNNGQMGSDAIPEFCEQLLRIPSRKKKVDILVVSQGGDPIVPWRIISMLRERFTHIEVLVPYYAQSAATLLALGADKIVMHPFSCLGPIDPQITSFNPNNPNQPPRQFSVEDLKCYAEYMRDLSVPEPEFGKDALEYLSRALDPLAIGAAKKSMKLSEDLASKLLSLHMNDAEKVAGIVKEYNSKSNHGYTIGRSEALAAGLPVVFPSHRLETLMWEIWQNAEEEMKCRVPFIPEKIVMEVKKDQPAPQIIEDSDIAIVESCRLRSAFANRAVIGLVPASSINSAGINIASVTFVPLGWNRTEHQD